MGEVNRADRVGDSSVALYLVPSLTEDQPVGRKRRLELHEREITDAERERLVLGKAVRALERWVGELPTSSPWRVAFEQVLRAVRASLRLRPPRR